jgi:sigma-B regulation protein RsbU (phosphoserine phosphatase)
MDQRKLYRTIESLQPERFDTSDELLTHLLEEIVKHEGMKMRGGRIWKLNPRKNSYVLLKQIGEIEHLPEGFSIRISEYPPVFEIARRRSVVAEETHKFLRKKGIGGYAATGIGEKVKVRNAFLYPYLIAFNSDTKDDRLLDTLNIVSSAATSILKSKRIEAQTKLLEQDLDQAYKIQKSILPAHQLTFGDYELFGVSLPDRIVGGDFFDYLAVGDDSDRIGVVIGDAASKGLPAAIEALYVSGALKMGAAFESKMTTLIRRINNLVDQTFADERFVTLFYAELFNNTNGLCLYANAGHNAPMYYKAATGTIELLENTGPVLGLAPDQKYQTENINLAKGDILLLYTDGIVEAVDVNFKLYGEERLKQKLLQVKDLAPREITESILEEVQHFSAQATYSDDKTLVAIKRVR